MSSYEYDDLYQKCQTYAPYHMFIYDVVESKQILDKNRQQMLYTLIHTVYHKLQQLELERNKKILHTSSLFPSEGFAYLQEPFLIDGDTIGFTIIRDSIPSEEVNELFHQTKEELQIPYQFHYADGYYETDLYAEGNEKYFRGYCIQHLNTIHKKTKEL